MTTGPTARIALSISTRADSPAHELPTYHAVQIAMEDLARRDDLPLRLELGVFDDAGDTARTAAMAAEIVADPRYLAVVGPMGSNEAFANAPVFDRAGLLQVSPCASHPDLCRRGWRTFFRLVPNEETQGRELARMATAHLGARRIAIVADSDAFGSSVSDNFRAGVEAQGATVAAVARFDRGAEDFAEVADAVLAARPDLAFFAVHGLEGRKVSSLLRERGLRVPFLGTDGLKTSFFLGGGDGRGEAYHTHSGADFRRLASAAAFRAAYLARAPEDSTYSPEAYDAVMLVAEAVRRAATPSRRGVLDAFRALGPWDGITGTVAFDEAGERVDAPISFYQVHARDGGREMRYLGTTTELSPAH